MRGSEYSLKDDWKPVGKSKRAKMLADFLNAIALQFNRAEVVSGGTAKPTENGLRIEAAGSGGLDLSNINFGYSIAGNVCTINSGNFRIHNIGNYAIATSTPLTLTGAEAWVYVQHATDHSSTSVQFAAIEPESNGTYYKVPLYHFVQISGSGNNYEINRICHLGDINFGAPIA